MSARALHFSLDLDNVPEEWTAIRTANCIGLTLSRAMEQTGARVSVKAERETADQIAQELICEPQQKARAA